MPSIEERIRANTQKIITSKAAIAQAITAKGVSTSNTATFSVMAANIDKLGTRTLELAIPAQTLPAAATWQSFYHGSLFTQATGLPIGMIVGVVYSVFSDIANSTANSGYHTRGAGWFGFGTYFGTTYYAPYSTGTYTHIENYHPGRESLYVRAGNSAAGCTVHGAVYYVY